MTNIHLVIQKYGFDLTRLNYWKFLLKYLSEICHLCQH